MALYRKLILFLLVAIPLECFASESNPCGSQDEKNEFFGHKSSQSNKVKRATSGRETFSKFSEDLENGINKQIKIELFAHYTYLSIAYYFDHSDMKMDGFHNFFSKMAQEEHEHAQMFMKYQNKRGGKIDLKSIPAPCMEGNWLNGTMAMRKALELERTVNTALIDLYKISGNDTQFQDFLETNFLAEQVESIKQLNDYVNTLERMNSPLGEYHFDRMTLQDKK